MKKYIFILIGVLQIGCSSIHKVKVLEISCPEGIDLCVFIIEKSEKSENKVYEISTFQYDSVSKIIKKVEKGDIVKIKLLKSPKLRFSEHITVKDRFFINQSNELKLIDENYYTPDIVGMYYFRIRN